MHTFAYIHAWTGPTRTLWTLLSARGGGDAQPSGVSPPRARALYENVTPTTFGCRLAGSQMTPKTLA